MEGKDNNKNNICSAIVIVGLYAFWLLFVLGIVSIASVLACKTGLWRWMNLCWIILLLAPNIKYRTPNV